MQAIKLQKFIINQLINTKVEDIITIDVSKKSNITDYMIICTGTSNRHITSVSDKLVKACHEQLGIIPLSIEGRGISDWIIIDLGDMIVHIMQKDSRRMYELEKLWG